MRTETMDRLRHGRHSSPMIADSTIRGAALTQWLNDQAHSQADRWLAACQGYLEWHRQHIVRQEPAEPERLEAEKTLLLMLRFTRCLHGQLVDPQWAQQRLAADLAETLWKLEQAWLDLHPLEAAAADAILSRCFPA